MQNARHFNIDDWVLIDRRNLQVRAGNNISLTRKWLGPYKVVKAISSRAYKLEVPAAARWHNVVYTTVLKAFRRRDKPQDMDKDKEKTWKVEEIVNSRKVKGVV